MIYLRDQEANRIVRRLEEEGYATFDATDNLNVSSLIFLLQQLLGIKSEFVRRPSTVNSVHLGHGNFRSGSNESLGLHQEGYNLPEKDRPRYLCLYCIMPGSRGETQVVNTQRVTAELRPGLLEKLLPANVRFKRLESGASWTNPTSLFWSFGGDAFSFCYAEQEEGFRAVQIEGVSDAERRELEGCLRKNCEEISWSKGKTLIIDNYKCLHGRAAIDNCKPRKLLRIVF